MATSPVQLLSGLRVAVGAGAWAAPNTTGKLFGLDPDNNPQASFMARLFGIRDIALGLGTTATTGSSRRLWWQLGIACDLADAAAAALAARNGTLPKVAAVMAGTTAIAAAGLGVAALATADDGAA
jgi:hypothetical protein